MSDGTTSMQFQYDSDGIRTQKTVNGITMQYTTLDGRITGQSDGTTVMQFIYTEEGTPFGMMVNGEPYLYVTNQQGDVTMVTDRSGLPLCSYTYDAWGNVLSIAGEDTEIGELTRSGTEDTIRIPKQGCTISKAGTTTRRPCGSSMRTTRTLFRWGQKRNRSLTCMHTV